MSTLDDETPMDENNEDQLVEKSTNEEQSQLTSNETDADLKKEWFVVHCYSGYE